jgi:hypothetical protein
MEFTAGGVDSGLPSSSSGIAGTVLPEAAAGVGSDFLAQAGPLPGVRRPARAGSFIPTLLIFLIPYSVVATIAAVVFYVRRPEPEPSLEILPDPQPDRKTGGPSRPAKPRSRVKYDIAVPEKLRVGLPGSDLRTSVEVGDLVVTPLAVEWVGEDLRLTLKMRNRSDDLEFNPVSDAFLDYPRVARKEGLMPYTFLETGKDVERWVFGGKWQVLRDGEPFGGRLGPGQAMTAQLTTDPRDRDLVAGLKMSRGPLLWRVQVRRGFIQYKGRQVSTTAVVGVEFAGKDIGKVREFAQDGLPTPRRLYKVKILHVSQTSPECS